MAIPIPSSKSDLSGSLRDRLKKSPIQAFTCVPSSCSNITGKTFFVRLYFPFSAGERDISFFLKASFSFVIDTELVPRFFFIILNFCHNHFQLK
ncbi:MAG: hypothetical protein WCG25_07925 [bacterium]